MQPIEEPIRQTFVTNNNLQSFALSSTVDEAVAKQLDFVIVSSCLNLLAYNKTSEIINSNGTDIICPSLGFSNLTIIRQTHKKVVHGPGIPGKYGWVWSSRNYYFTRRFQTFTKLKFNTNFKSFIRSESLQRYQARVQGSPCIRTKRKTFDQKILSSSAIQSGLDLFWEISVSDVVACIMSGTWCSSQCGIYMLSNPKRSYRHILMIFNRFITLIVK